NPVHPWDTWPSLQAGNQSLGATALNNVSYGACVHLIRLSPALAARSAGIVGIRRRGEGRYLVRNAGVNSPPAGRRLEDLCLNFQTKPSTTIPLIGAKPGSGTESAKFTGYTVPVSPVAVIPVTVNPV